MRRVVHASMRSSAAASSGALGGSCRPAIRAVPGRHASLRAAAADVAQPEQEASSSSQLTYSHLLLTIIDTNPYLSDGSRQVVAIAAGLAKAYNSKVTVLLVDPPGGAQELNTDTRKETLGWHMKNSGCPEYEVLEKEVESQSSVLVGDVADQVNADMVLLSADAVHAKQVDANLLAEFVSCPILLLP